jgi:curved DNA-binding protein CbpA
MNQKQDPIIAAYRVFGLEGDEDFETVRKTFRSVIKTVHPDTSGDQSAKAVGKLQRMLKAYEVLRVYAPRYHELTITPEEARKGGLRTVFVGERNVMVRILPYSKTGAVVVPVGDSKWRVKLLVRDVIVDGGQEMGKSEKKARDRKAQELRDMERSEQESEDSAGLLRAFCDMFVKSPPAARLANWVRNTGKNDKAA